MQTGGAADDCGGSPNRPPTKPHTGDEPQAEDSDSDPDLQSLLRNYEYQSNLTLSFGRDGTTHYTISAVSAEHLKKCDVTGFKGSSFAQIPGYGMTEKVDLKVRNSPADAKNVENLWHQVLEAKEAGNRKEKSDGGGKKVKKGKKSVFRPLTDG